MSVKKQISSMCKLYFFYDGKPQEFYVESDVDNSFYQNILTYLNPSNE